jgi:hypothetical protein
MARLVRGGECTEGPKRLYLDAAIEDECPSCGAVSKRSFNDYCLSYPKLNGLNKISMFCEEDDCDSEWILHTSIWVEFDFENREVIK